MGQRRITTEPTLREVVRELRALRRALAPAEGTFSVEEAAKELGCSVSRVYALIADGKLARAPKAGRHSRVTVKSVRDFQATGESANEPPRPARQARSVAQSGDVATAIRSLPVKSR